MNKEDREEKEALDDGCGFMQYDLDNDKGSSADTTPLSDGCDGDTCSRRSPLRLLVSVMLSPVEGWKGLRRSKIRPEEMEHKAFYPMLALTAVSKFFAFFYGGGTGLESVLVSAVVAFVTLFFSYYIIVALGGLIPGQDGARPMDTSFGKNFILVCLSSLAVFGAIESALPMLGPVTVFLPLWTIYLISRGVRMLRVASSRRMSSVVMLSVMTVGIPAGLRWVFFRIMPGL